MAQIRSLGFGRLVEILGAGQERPAANHLNENAGRRVRHIARPDQLLGQVLGGPSGSLGSGSVAATAGPVRDDAAGAESGSRTIDGRHTPVGARARLAS